MHRKDLYSILEIARDVGDDEIKSAYKSKALLFHPDRSQRLVGFDQKSREHVNEMFNDLHEAFVVLSDPRKRAIYDSYGYEGLEASTQLGTHLTEREDVLREMERLQQIERIRDFEKKMFGRTTLTAHIDARKLLRWQGPLEVPSLSMQQAVQSPLTPEWTLAMNAEATMKSGHGSATLSTVFIRKLLMGLLQLGGQLNTERDGRLTLIPSVVLQAPIDIDKQGTLQAYLHPAHGPMLDFGIKQTLGPQVVGELNLSQRGSDVKISAGVEASLWEKCRISANVTVGTISKLKAKATYFQELWADCNGWLSIICSSTGIRGRLGVSRKLSELSVGSVVAVLSPGDLVLLTSLRRGAHKMSLPIQISSEPTALLGMLIACTPVSALYAYEKVREFSQHRASRLKVSQARSASLGRVQVDREKAQVAQSVMRGRALQKKSNEEERGGLIIVQAKFGNLHARSGDRDRHPDFPAWIDVTIVIQNLVEKSKLELRAEMSKAQLHGFYDPCPGEPKWLEIEYRFKGKRHRVEVGEDSELRIPLSAHAILD